jgi:hypothetical protein
MNTTVMGGNAIDATGNTQSKYEYIEDLVDLVSELFGDRMIFSSNRDKPYYYFKDNRWRFARSSLGLFDVMGESIMKGVRHYYINVLKTIIENGATSADKDVQRVVRLIDRWERSALIHSTTETALLLSYREDFEKNLDRNKNLVGFNNGVYDIEKSEFRPGKPADMVSNSVGYDYEEYDLSDPIFKEIEEFFKNIFPDSEVREYFFKYLGAILNGQAEESDESNDP